VADRNRFEDGILVSRLYLISQSSLQDLITTVGRFFFGVIASIIVVSEQET